METIQWNVFCINNQEMIQEVQQEIGAEIVTAGNTETNGINSEPVHTQVIYTDAENARLVAGLQVKKFAYEYVYEMTERIKEMLDPTAGMSEAEKNAYDRKVMNKVYSGKELTAEELRYIKIHYPALYPQVMRVQIQRKAFEERIKHCHSKEEVQEAYAEAMFHVGENDPARQMLYAAYDDVLKAYQKTSEYEELPEIKEDAEEQKRQKKLSFTKLEEEESSEPYNFCTEISFELV